MMTKMTLRLLAGTGILVLGAGGVWWTMQTAHPVATTTLQVKNPWPAAQKAASQAASQAPSSPSTTKTSTTKTATPTKTSTPKTATSTKTSTTKTSTPTKTSTTKSSTPAKTSTPTTVKSSSPTKAPGSTKTQSPTVVKTSTPTKTSTTKTSTPTKTFPAAQTYPSLAATVAREPVATASQIQAALDAHNPVRLGELNWSAREGTQVLTAWGNTQASADTTTRYAETFLYALLSNNASVFQNAAICPDSQGFGYVSPLQIQGTPTDVSVVDQVQMGPVSKALPWQAEYPYTVTFTTTAGQIAHGHGYVALQKSPHGGHWTLGITGMLPGE